VRRGLRHDHVLAHLCQARFGALAGLGFVGLDEDAKQPCMRLGLCRSRAFEVGLDLLRKRLSGPVVEPGNYFGERKA
jgi:hypothetical protein